ncbi:MAG TPA: aminotransferase class I/II-fold pyridoxal phosphate-dependent enzyme, partial [bacterium]|nr:aminotransferase class I/II-fold pyridoxal phosphate-dependent enzyme [bacterium]
MDHRAPSPFEHPYDPSWAFASRAIHGPQRYKDLPHEPTVEAIYMNSTFRFPGAAETEAWFREPKDHFVYSRYGNPTVRDFEERMAALEGGADGVAFSSGTGAFLGALLSVAQAGQHVLLQRYCYGGSYYLAHRLGAELGIGCTLVDPQDHQSLEAGLRPETTALLIESPANPMAAIVDLRAAA